jgi:hypothetical protein
MTEDEERKIGWLKNLRHAWKAFDACSPTDANGRTDIMRRIRKCESELVTFGVGQAEIAAYNLREDRHERRGRKMIRDAYYHRTGAVPNET